MPPSRPEPAAKARSGSSSRRWSGRPIRACGSRCGAWPRETRGRGLRGTSPRRAGRSASRGPTPRAGRAARGASRSGRNLGRRPGRRGAQHPCGPHACDLISSGRGRRRLQETRGSGNSKSRATTRRELPRFDHGCMIRRSSVRVPSRSPPPKTPKRLPPLDPLRGAFAMSLALPMVLLAQANPNAYAMGKLVGQIVSVVLVIALILLGCRQGVRQEVGDSRSRYGSTGDLAGRSVARSWSSRTSRSSTRNRRVRRFSSNPPAPRTPTRCVNRDRTGRPGGIAR